MAGLKSFLVGLGPGRAQSAAIAPNSSRHSAAAPCQRPLIAAAPARRRPRLRQGHVCRQQNAAVAANEEDPGGGGELMATVEMIEAASSAAPALQLLNRFSAPKWLFRTVACLILGGQVIARICKGNIHWRNTRDQLQLVGPKSLGVALLTAGFVGMVFTIQVSSTAGSESDHSNTKSRAAG
eukprot:GHUV01025002.1.p2 GENE.GHUV01025002.1~~GHUV01025002.1.p2  ORF type:complete len:182 (+),score=43.83 GHUV01025002.1:331-876(+)